MADATAKYEKDVETLKEELAQLRSDLGDLVGSVKELGKHTADSARDKAQAEFTRCVDQLGQAYNSLRSQGGEAVNRVHHTVEERPVATAAVAFGVGLVLGKLLSSK